MISKTDVVAQKPHERQLNAKVCGSIFRILSLILSSSKVTAPQDAHKRLVLQVYLGWKNLELSAIRR